MRTDVLLVVFNSFLILPIDKIYINQLQVGPGDLEDQQALDLQIEYPFGLYKQKYILGKD